MKLKTETELIEDLKRVRDAGGDFLNSLYVYRSVQRALPDSKQDPEALDAVLAVMESSLMPLFVIEQVKESLLLSFQQSVEFLARVDGLTSSDLRASLIQTLGLVHLLDGVKDNKVSVRRDIAFYEEALTRRREYEEEDKQQKKNRQPFNDEQYEICRRLREVFLCRWWFLTELLGVLARMTKSVSVMADLLGLLTRGLCTEEDGSGPVFLPHDRYKLLRALPIVLYLHHFLRKKQVVPTDPIPAKVMDACFKLLRRYPVVPGVGDYAVLLYVPILGIVFMPGGGYAKDMKKQQVTSLDELEGKYLEYLEREYSLASRHFQMRDVHDHLCDRLSRTMKKSESWNAAGERMPLNMCQEAVDLSFRILKHLSEWRCGIHELLAWRKSAPALHETFHSSGDSPKMDRLPNRVIRVFHDADVPLVLETLVCVNGLANLFKKTKDHFLPSIENWLSHVVHLFLEQTSKKRSMGGVDVRKIFSTIENLKLHILEGHHSLYEMSSSHRTASELLFDPRDPGCLVKLRKAAEELNFLCSLHPSKSKISSYICGHPGAAAPGVQKATKDLLHQLYIMQEVLKAEEHLDKILDFFDISMREREIEVTGSVQVNRGSAVALQLAHGAIKSSYGGSLQPVFTALELFDGASEKLLNVYKSQLIFLELRQTAMEGLEVVLDEVCKQAVIQAKIHACVTSVNIAPSAWVEEINGVPSRPLYRFDCVFQKKTFCLAGYDVDIQTALVDRLDTILKMEYQKIVGGLESTKDPTLIASCHTRIEILKSAHAWLASELPLTPWESYVEDEEAEEEEQESHTMTCLSSVVRDCILQKLLEEFSFDQHSHKFKAGRSSNADPFTFKISARPSTPKIGFNEPRNEQGSQGSVFGFDDVCVVHGMMTPSEREQWVAEVQSYAMRELSEFMHTGLAVLFSFVPLELIDMRISDLNLREDYTAIECLSFVMEKFGNDIAETATWVEPLKNLERIGNAWILLHWIDVCRTKHDISDFIAKCSSFKDFVDAFLEPADPERNANDLDSGNPFEMEIRKKKAALVEKEPEKLVVQKPSRSEIMNETAQMAKAFVEECNKEQSRRRLNTRNAMSTVLFLKTFAQANAQMMNLSCGDGILWAASLITQFSNEDLHFESVDWIHEILSLTQVDDMLTPLQIPNDIRSFLTHAQRTPTSSPENRDGSKALKMFKEPPLRGAFGGICHVPSTVKRKTMHNISRSSIGPMRASLLKNKNPILLSQSTRCFPGSSSFDPGVAVTNASNLRIEQDTGMQPPTPSLDTWRVCPEGSSPYLHHRHSG